METGGDLIRTGVVLMRPADRRINGQTGGPEDSLCSLYLRIFTQRRTQKFHFSISFSHISFADLLSFCCFFIETKEVAQKPPAD